MSFRSFHACFSVSSHSRHSPPSVESLITSHVLSLVACVAISSMEYSFFCSPSPDILLLLLLPLMLPAAIPLPLPCLMSCQYFDMIVRVGWYL